MAPLLFHKLPAFNPLLEVGKLGIMIWPAPPISSASTLLTTPSVAPEGVDVKICTSDRSGGGAPRGFRAPVMTRRIAHFIVTRGARIGISNNFPRMVGI
jgi:hypothetical protein